MNITFEVDHHPQCSYLKCPSCEAQLQHLTSLFSTWLEENPTFHAQICHSTHYGVTKKLIHRFAHEAKLTWSQWNDFNDVKNEESSLWFYIAHILTNAPEKPKKKKKKTVMVSESESDAF